MQVVHLKHKLYTKGKFITDDYVLEKEHLYTEVLAFPRGWSRGAYWYCRIQREESFNSNLVGCLYGDHFGAKTVLPVWSAKLQSSVGSKGEGLC